MTLVYMPRAEGSLTLALSPHGLPLSEMAEKIIMHPSRTGLHLLFLQLCGQTSVSGISDTHKLVSAACVLFVLNAYKTHIQGYAFVFCQTVIEKMHKT